MTTPPTEDPSNAAAPADEQASPLSGGAAGAGLGCLAGAILVPVIVFVIVLIRNQFDPVCGTPADSGGCEMGLFAIPITSIVPGVMIGILAGFLLGWLRAARR